MSLKTNYEYIRDWANAKFLKKTDQVKVDLSNYATKSELDSAGVWEVNNGVTYLKSDNGQSSHGGGSMSVAEGSNCTANGMYSHAEGYSTYSGSNSSHAEGSRNSANGTASHAEGAYTTANSSYSHSEGYNTTANGYCSHAEGYYTTTQNRGEHASGSYNSSTSGQTTFSHGIGTSGDNKNAIEIMSNGDVFIYGLGNYTGNNYSSASSLQTLLSTLDTDFISVEDYQNDEEVIAAALNDLNSRLIVPKITNSITLPTNGTSLNVNSYITWDEGTIWKVKNGFEKRISINNVFWDYGTYGGYTGHFYYNDSKIYVFTYDSVNDIFIITWINPTS